MATEAVHTRQSRRVQRQSAIAARRSSVRPRRDLTVGVCGPRCLELAPQTKRGGQSCRTMLRRELSILRPPLYSMSPRFLNLFMKKFTRPRVVPDHFRKRLLGDLRYLSLRTGLLAVTREQQKRSGEPLFTRVEELVDEVRFDADVPRHSPPFAHSYRRPVASQFGMGRNSASKRPSTPTRLKSSVCSEIIEYTTS